ncbi:MAG TPA: hypothetical protein VK698_04595 [Kofleriaceae bacterium]|nr:hypothetical protein [Kofleriaceae bacterium]
MFLAAIVVGLLVAYYFGVRPGMIAAGGAVALFLVAVVVPVAAMYVYALVCVGVAGVVVLGPKLKRPDALASGMGGLRGGALRAIGMARRAVRTVQGKDVGKGKGNGAPRRRGGW